MKTITKRLGAVVVITLEVPETEDEADELEWPDSNAKILKIEAAGRGFEKEIPLDEGEEAASSKEMSWTIVEEEIETPIKNAFWIGLLLHVNRNL